jgi:hypothetical protein
MMDSSDRKKDADGGVDGLEARIFAIQKKDGKTGSPVY